MTQGIIKGGAALLLAAAVGVGLPYYCGLRFEQQFRASVAELGKRFPLPVEIVSYERHLYSATAETRVTLPPGAVAAQAGEPLVILLHHDITHGPRLDGFRAVRMRTLPILPDDVQAGLHALIHDQPLVESINDFGFTGALSGQIRAPAFDIASDAIGPPSDGIAWKGFECNYRLSGDHRSARFDLSLPKLETPSAEGGSLRVEAMKLEGRLQRASTNSLWLGDIGFTLAGLEGSFKDAAFRLSDFAFTSSTSEAGGAARSATSITARALDLGDEKYDQPRLHLSLSELDSATLAELGERMNAIAVSGGDESKRLQAAVEAFKASASRLAARKPMLKLDELSVTTPAGRAAVKGTLQYIGKGGIDDFAPATDLLGSLSFEMPETMFDSLAAKQAETAMRRHLELDSETVESDAARDMTRSLAAQNALALRTRLLAQKLLVLDGSVLRSSVDYRDGQLLVNGAPYPPAQSGPLGD